MNVGIDFDDTITHNPEFFRELTASLHRAGDRTYIISSHTKADEPIADRIFTEKTRMLREYGITYAELQLVVEPIPENKAKACRDHNIRFMIDNDPENVEEISRLSRGTVCMQYINSTSGTQH